MINNPGLPGFQRFQLNNSPITVSRSNNTAVFPTQTSTICATPASNEGGDEELRRLRSNYVVLIERMLRNHQPHDVLNHVPENTDWRSKTFKLALKIERLMFKAAKSRADYMNEHTLSRRVKVLCRHLVRIRMRKNAMTEGLTNRC
ncbi:hypothetical protein F442_20655 [Phytophthora nicotianae P10297]|uniref:Mediator complex subunit 15 KIX domain-containing protein n=4 Tax=Phytophthora nicotianae TaxID=4792 RepID=V9DZN1_PHYNI|nr:hypothetical protein F443_20856 [Phytophthora nicotianae P1569]ETL79334.1 hypothetical protein L917_20008 [Phytophthora nicotianae]ETM32576.1 hypothetical protein L914_20035 [Phytophthora nicotianae]ETO61013.1 hypothetical protein F444_20879 [Phytophthora nicotianae P1976]ETP30306.1 hypothetical protein F442_20655 [Phytophthora nicotianae P10297]